MSSDTNQNSDTKTNPQIHEYTSVFLSNNSPLGFNDNKNLYVQEKKKKKSKIVYMNNQSYLHFNLQQYKKRKK